MNLLQLMMSFLNSIPRAFAPLRSVFEALGRLFDRHPNDRAQAILQQAEELVRDIEGKAAFADKWFRDMFADIDTLLKYWPGLVKLVYVAHNTRADQHIDLHTALVVAELEANVLKMNQKIT